MLQLIFFSYFPVDFDWKAVGSFWIFWCECEFFNSWVDRLGKIVNHIVYFRYISGLWIRSSGFVFKTLYVFFSICGKLKNFFFQNLFLFSREDDILILDDSWSTGLRSDESAEIFVTRTMCVSRTRAISRTSGLNLMAAGKCV